MTKLLIFFIFAILISIIISIIAVVENIRYEKLCVLKVKCRTESHKLKEKIRHHDPAIVELARIHDIYRYETFETIQPIEYTVSHKKKYQFDNFDFDLELYSFIKDNLSIIENYVEKDRKNAENYTAYLEEYEDIVDRVGDQGISHEDCEDFYKALIDYQSFKRRTEVKFSDDLCRYVNDVYDDLISEYSIKSPGTFSIKISHSYKSECGRNYYFNSKCYDIKSISAVLEKIKEDIKNIDIAHMERSKMTPSLRYDIMKRDNFRCKICGLSPYDDDQIKLHVDHIIPISKGGKTIASNLRTLCSICNLGKSDKYDFDGLN